LPFVNPVAQAGGGNVPGRIAAGVLQEFVNALGRFMEELEVIMAMKRSSTTKSAPGRPAVLAAGSSPVKDSHRAVEKLMAMGDGETAYLRKFRAGDLGKLFPQISELHPSVELFALFGADGTPLILADTRDAVLAGAWDQKLTLSALH
jgi:hypothetical protein